MIISATASSPKLQILGAQNQLQFHAQNQVETRLAGKSPATAKAIFSTQDHGAGVYVRNPQCWAAGMDLTCISPWNNWVPWGGVVRAGTVISPLHVIYAVHFFLQVGVSLRFITADNVVISRTIVAVVPHPDYVPTYPDLGIAVLDSPLPASIKPAKILPADALAKLPSDGNWRIPCLVLDQEEKALVIDCITEQTSGQFRTTFFVPISSPSLDFNEGLIPGDSGNPFFMIVNGEPILLTVATAETSGTSIRHFAPWINSVMVASGYQLQPADLSSFISDP